MDLDLTVKLAGPTIALIGFAYGFAQNRRSKRLQTRLQEQRLVFINRANYVAGDHRIIDHYAGQTDDKFQIRTMWLDHQGCDLYMMLVDACLSREESFTYKDLEVIREGPLVGGRWQEQFWVSLLALRKENRESPAPAPLTYSPSGRFDLLQAHLAGEERGALDERRVERA